MNTKILINSPAGFVSRVSGADMELTVPESGRVWVNDSEVQHGAPAVAPVPVAPAPVPVPQASGPNPMAWPQPGPNMDPEYAGAHKGMYFPHGPAVGLNAQGQAVDAEGRTAGPPPASAAESEIEQMIRVGGKHFSGSDVSYDAWGNRLGSGLNFVLAPVYDTEQAMVDAATAGGYQGMITVGAPNATDRSNDRVAYPGFPPADRYVLQPDGRVERAN